MKNDGTVWKWEQNSVRQLPGQSNVVSIGCGKEHCLALKNDGTFWTWGHNYFGQVGDGTGGSKNWVKKFLYKLILSRNLGAGSEIQYISDSSYGSQFSILKFV
ncbi:MAG: hypothetical protein HQM08_25115 [Candidatus Riflebacteria bacterium]|nr:hypothetical protein [Candidatus Riflebacteria bacterium]